MKRIGRKKPLKPLKLLGGAGGAAFFFALAFSGVISAVINITLMIGTVVLPVIIGGIAFIAVLVAKVAFVLVGVAGMKTMMEANKPEKVKIITKELPFDYGGNGGKFGKQLQGKETSHDLVYSSYIPESVTQSVAYPYYQQYPQ